MPTSPGTPSPQGAIGGPATTRRPTPADAKLEADVDNIVESAVAEFVKAADVEVPGEPTETDETVTPPKQDEAEEAESPDETPKDDADEPAEAAPASRAAAAIMRREAALTKRERDLADRERQLTAKLAEVQKAGPQPGVEDVVRLAKIDPVGFYTRLGLDVGDIGRIMLANKLGDKAPPQYQALARDHALRTESETRQMSLEQKIAALESRLAAKETAQATDAEVRAFKPDPKVMPRAAKFAAANPDYFAREIMREIVDDARTRIGSEGADAQALTAAEAAKRVEKRLALYGLDVPPAAGSQNDANATKKNGTTSKRAALQTRAPKQVQESEDYDTIAAKAMADFLGPKD